MTLPSARVEEVTAAEHDHDAWWRREQRLRRSRDRRTCAAVLGAVSLPPAVLGWWMTWGYGIRLLFVHAGLTFLLLAAVVPAVAALVLAYRAHGLVRWTRLLAAAPALATLVSLAPPWRWTATMGA